MADGEINRNGATIRIDDDGGVQVEPAPGQEVEYTAPDLGTEAIRESVNTESASVNGPLDAETATVGRLNTDAGGEGYAWQDVTGSRSLNTWNQAPPDRDIYFSIRVLSSAADTTIRLAPNVNTSQDEQRISEEHAVVGDGERTGTQPIKVPATQYYRVETFGDETDYDLDDWYELR